MKYGSVCSGIEAASVAWEPLGFQAQFFSEIEPFPCAVLNHHWPHIPNHGDMTKFEEWPNATIDILIGGTPCQSFSIAGLRKGLADPRGNLMLTYLAIAARYSPEWLVWENVPGVLSSNQGRDFAALLNGLAELGYGFAYRILDAKHFGVPQRRRRVFLVANYRSWQRAAAVLFERASLSGNIAPSENTQKNASAFIEGSFGAYVESPDAGTIKASGGALAGGSESLVIASRKNETGTLLANCGDKQFLGNQEAFSGDFFVVNGRQDPCTSDQAFTLDCQYSGNTNVVAIKGNIIDRAPENGGNGLGVDDSGVSYTLTATDRHAVGVFKAGQGARAHSIGGNGLGVDGGGITVQMGETLYNKGFNHGGIYASTQETHAGKILRTLREAVGEEVFAKWGLGILKSLQSPEILRQALHGRRIRPAAFSRSWVVYCALSRAKDSTEWLLQSLRETGCEGCPPQGWELPEQLARELGAYLSELSQPGAQASRFMRDLWWASQGTGLLREALSAIQEVGRPAGGQGQSILGSSEGWGEKADENVLSSGMQCEVSRERVLHKTCATGEARDSREGTAEQERSGKGWVGETPFAVRRLTVEECEFLQGFPRGYTQIPWRGKPAEECPDGPRYKAIGNSMAVPVMRWIGERIQQVSEID